MTEIEKAERDCRNLEEQRESLFSRAKSLSLQRDKIAFAAHTGDAKAKVRLKEINIEIVVHGQNIESVEAALNVARANLESSKIAEAVAVDTERAKQIAALNAKLKDELENADDALADAFGSVLSARKLLMEIHALGISSPNDNILRINSVAAIKTAIQLLPQSWINDFEFARLAPNQKKLFRSLGESWGAAIERQIADRLPKDKAA